MSYGNGNPIYRTRDEAETTARAHGWIVKPDQLAAFYRDGDVVDLVEIVSLGWQWRTRTNTASRPHQVGRRYCECGHTSRQHEIRAGGRFGCYIDGCLCIDFADEIGAPVPTTTNQQEMTR